jgi:predicted  nucleic acid-binding Zn-ribbon protein
MLKTAPSLKPKKKLKKKELKAERDALQSKLNSMRSLLDFIEKKFQAGTMDKKSYEKRTSQLKIDLKKTEKQLEEINDLL